MNGVGDIERMEVSYYKDFRAIFQSVLRSAFIWTQRSRRVCARNLAKGTRTKIDSITVATADAIAYSINSGTDDGRL